MNYKNLALIIASALFVWTPSMRAQDFNVGSANLNGAVINLGLSVTQNIGITSPILALSPQTAAANNSGVTIGFLELTTLQYGNPFNNGANINTAGVVFNTGLFDSSTLSLVNWDSTGVVGGQSILPEDLAAVTARELALIEFSSGVNFGDQPITPDVDSPEPSTLAIIGLGSALGFFLHRRRQASRA